MCGCAFYVSGGRIRGNILAQPGALRMNPLTTVLIVDDEAAVRDLMARWAESLGLDATTACNSDEALECLRDRRHDLAVIDIMMPGRNGLWLAQEVRRGYPETAVVLATAHTEKFEDADARTPIADFLVKPFLRDRFALAVDRGREWRRQVQEDASWYARLALELESGVAALVAALKDRRSRGAAEEGILLNIAADRAPDVMVHGERVARYSMSLARELKLDEATLRITERAARFHDIGKAAIPKALLTKPSRMTAGEFDIMRRHVEAGADLLEATETLQDLAPIVRTSHEWFGGGGYPAGLKGNGIPLVSRLIAVADAFDAMTETRAYRGQLDRKDAVKELVRCAPSQFDPVMVTAFLAVLEKH
jgi:putative nucleotidyltransferase with HDIG domain